MYCLIKYYSLSHLLLQHLKYNIDFDPGNYLHLILLQVNGKLHCMVVVVVRLSLAVENAEELAASMPAGS